MGWGIKAASEARRLAKPLGARILQGHVASSDAAGAAGEQTVSCHSHAPKVQDFERHVFDMCCNINRLQ